MNQTDAQKKSRGSVVVIAVLLAVALALAVFFQLSQPPAQGALVAKVTQDSAVVATLPLDQNTRQTFTCEEGVNTVVVEAGAVHIEDADCAGGDCMKQGTIDAQGRLLVCLPHKLIVEIVPANDDTAPSVYTGEEVVGSSDAAGIDVVAQ